jgi:hypothetical protein
VACKKKNPEIIYRKTSRNCKYVLKKKEKVRIWVTELVGSNKLILSHDIRCIEQKNIKE